MKNTHKSTLILFLLTFSLFSAQQNGAIKIVDKNEKVKAIKNMTPDQKMNLLQGFRQNLIIEDLQIPENKQQEFSALYDEYQKSQRNIKSNFQRAENFENLNDAEAQKELDASFEVGQKLLDNKKEYSKKFQKVIKPQQVLQMFESEGKMRTKVRERSQDVQSRRAEQSFRNQDSSTQGRNMQNRQPNSSQKRR